MVLASQQEEQRVWGCEGMRNFPLRSIQEKQDFESSIDGIFVSSPKFMLRSNPQYAGTKVIGS